MAIALDISTLRKKDWLKVKNLVVEPKKSQYTNKQKRYAVYAINRKDEAVYVPILQYRAFFDEEFPYTKDEYTSTNIKFIYDLYTPETDPLGRGRDQKQVFKESIQKLKTQQSVAIAAFTGFGKTSLTTALMCHLKLKTFILCHNDPLKKQWRDEIKKFTGGKAKVQMLEGSKPLNPKADVYICGVIKAKTLARDDVLDIGLVIIDEMHQCTLAAFTVSLLRFQPMYLIGLSATPDRPDGLHKIFDFYFGSPKEFIVREEVKDFTVVKYQTNYEPDVSYRFVPGRGEVEDFVAMTSSLCENEERWKEIAQIAIDHPENKIILLCDRTNMIKNIYKYLLEKGESAEFLISGKKTWDKSKRILVAGVKKAGVGLDDPSLNMLIQAASIKDVRQCEGRIRCTGNLVIDIVDNYRTNENHWKKREVWYRKRGATIKIGGPRKKVESTAMRDRSRKQSIIPPPRFLKSVS